MPSKTVAKEVKTTNGTSAKKNGSEELTVHAGGKIDVVYEAIEVAEKAMARPMQLDAAPREIEIPAETQEKARLFIERYAAFLSERTEAHVQRAAMAQPEAGEPVLASGYQYWNCLTIGPIQFNANPPYRPSKIIAAGEPTLMLGVVWINPLNSDGGGLPGTVVLAGRNYRVCFETTNLSDVTNGPDALFVGAFGNPAAVINVFPWWFVPGDPGPKPNLYESTLTADIVEAGQPMAAFSTWHLDPDVEPAFLGRPTVGPQWQYDHPARFLVYRK